MTVIDIGVAATDRDLHADNTSTYIVKANPANGSGKITKIELYVNQNIISCRIGTMEQVSADVFTTRDYEDLGNLAAGYHSIDVDIGVKAGDYIAIQFSAGRLEADISGEGYWYHAPNGANQYIPCTAETFIFAADRTLSVYGEGVTLVGYSQAHIID